MTSFASLLIVNAVPASGVLQDIGRVTVRYVFVEGLGDFGAKKEKGDGKRDEKDPYTVPNGGWGVTGVGSNQVGGVCGEWGHTTLRWTGQRG